jgi:thiol:disulfide interchange protein DsbG
MRADNGFMRSVVAALFFAALPVIAADHSLAQAQDVEFKRMPLAAWQSVEIAEGVEMGETPASKPSIQVIFDANCPYCARLYALLLQDAHGMAVRWVPIAYLRDDSARLAAAILDANDPRAALDANFRKYDFHTHHGGYKLSPSTSTLLGLPAANVALKRQWRSWGGYTPMFLVKDNSGAILLTGGAAPDIVRSVLSRAAKPLKFYDAKYPEVGK